MATIKGTPARDILKGTPAADKLLGRAGNDDLLGAGGNDLLKGGIGADLLNGGAGNDKMFGELGIDTLLGGIGDDTLSGGAGNDTLKAGAGKDRLLGGGGNDKLFGGTGNDRLDGGDGKDTMAGGDGADMFVGGGGADRFIGGAGIDTVSYSTLTGFVRVDLAVNDAAGGAAGDTFSGIENVTGGAGEDKLSGNAGANTLRGLGDDDELFGRGGIDRLDGGDGQDTLEGGAGADLLIGGNGADTASYLNSVGGVTVDLMTGFTLNGDADGDTLIGIESLKGTTQGDVLAGDDGLNALYGYAGGDLLVGRGGNDWIVGGIGLDGLFGGEGNDILFPGNDDDADQVHGDAGDDTVAYLDAGSGVLVDLTIGDSAGAASGDTYFDVENLLGSSHGDILTPVKDGLADGFHGDDTIRDSHGTEILKGGYGEDDLTDIHNGEDGLRDIFYLATDEGKDTVFGFDKDVDLFWLDTRDFYQGSPPGSSPLLTFDEVTNSNSGPVATIAGPQLIYVDNATHGLWYDPDGTGLTTPELIAVLSGFNGTLDRSDFLLV